jgi:hypothetical protein
VRAPHAGRRVPVATSEGKVDYTSAEFATAETITTVAAAKSIRALRTARAAQTAAIHLDDAGRIARRARAFQFGDLPRGVLGSTDELGNITIQRGLTGRAFEETLRHETVHSVLTPPAPLNRLTVVSGPP